MGKFSEKSLGVFKYALAAFMVVIGVFTMIMPVEPMDGALGFLYSSRIFLVCFGVIISFSGAALLYGKIRRNRKWTGRGLLLIYLVFIFGAFLNGMAWNWVWDAWVPNLIASLIVGALYLRWKFKTEYFDPRHFVDDVEWLRRHQQDKKDS